MQKIFFKENVAIALANTELRELLYDGDVVNKPYRSKPRVATYSKGSDISIEDRFSTNEYLTVDTAKVVPFYVDDLDKIQNKWSAVDKFAADGQTLLNNILDQAIAGEAANAGDYFDDGDLGGTAGNNITVTTSNISELFTGASRKLDQVDVGQSKRFSLIGPRTLETLRLYLAGKDTGFADTVGRNGKVMDRFGFEIYYSNNCYFSARWTPANQPTAGDTITINGAVIEFVADVASLTSTAYIGVLIETNTATTLEHLVACINFAEATTEVEGTDWTTADANNDPARWKLTKAGIVATDGDTYVSIVGYGDIEVAASETADLWSVQQQKLLFGIKGATDLVVQKSPNVEFRKAEKRLGRYIYPWMLYGKKTFADGAEQLLDVRVNASSWS